MSDDDDGAPAARRAGGEHSIVEHSIVLQNEW
jgi:hypothetical protein